MLLNNYNEDFFEDNILLFYYKSESNISKNIVFNIEVKDNSLLLNTNRYEGMSTALSSWLYFITLEKGRCGKCN